MTYAKSILASAALLLVSGSAHAAVVINEALHVSGGLADFVELYNNGEDAVAIGDWTVESGTNPGSYAVRGKVPTGTSLPAGGYFVFYRTLDADAGVDADAGATSAGLTANLPAAGSNTDAIRIKDAASAVQDTLLFGNPNGEGFADDGSDGGAATSFAPKWSGTRSLGRLPNGVDTDMCGVDFQLTPNGQNTPGAANYEAPPPPDGGPSSSSSSGATSSSSSSSGGKSSSSGGKTTSSSSGGSKSDGGFTTSGGMNPEGDDDADNSNLTPDSGGCSSMGPGAPAPFVLGLGLIFALRRRRAAKRSM